MNVTRKIIQPSAASAAHWGFGCINFLRTGTNTLMITTYGIFQIITGNPSNIFYVVLKCKLQNGGKKENRVSERKHGFFNVPFGTSLLQIGKSQRMVKRNGCVFLRSFLVSLSSSLVDHGGEKGKTDGMIDTSLLSEPRVGQKDGE